MADGAGGAAEHSLRQSRFAHFRNSFPVNGALVSGLKHLSAVQWNPLAQQVPLDVRALFGTQAAGRSEVPTWRPEMALVGVQFDRFLPTEAIAFNRELLHEHFNHWTVCLEERPIASERQPTRYLFFLLDGYYLGEGVPAERAPSYSKRGAG